MITCAKQGRISGGPMDSIPPVFVKAVPPNYTTNFDGEEIRIYFDEYIKLKDYQRQLIVSPPLENTLISPQGSASKYISIEIKDTLQPNTTYVFNFGQSVVDNNEENPYSYFKYIMSTGDYIDSLTVRGEIKDALLRAPDNFVTVMLYEADSTYNDSIVYKDRPRYVTNTLDSLTTFEISNLKEGSYKLVAMKDEDANFTYQSKKDKIGFLEGFIDVPKDTSYVLTLFKEEATLKTSRPRHAAKQRLSFGFQGNADSLRVNVLSSVPADFESLITERKNDTLNYWYKPNVETDSLWLEIRGENYVDTTIAKLRDLKPDSLFFTPESRGTLTLKNPFKVTSSVPVTSINDSLISVTGDSIPVPFTTDINLRKSSFDIRFDTKEVTTYEITVLPDAITPYLGARNDTLRYKVRTKEFSDYGDIELTLVNAKRYPYIIQLIDGKGEVSKQVIANEGNVFKFETLSPGNYFIRLIEDANKNGIYDPGSYLEQRQAERVIYYPKEIEVNAGWLPRETFQLKD
ncbi:hypothetical protein EAX61_10430 [Dokdonia sinensis]|uniref:SbsA Ig-like domain-containing protein n=2 Tax=Dokdonia sinensis TaxID=2479847 RepID=A0A3M0GL56_9FLAO|nr:hypothetical protein EAX61_10430 [Dokdonia sinensis]